jgi:hypothetical protein
MSDDTPPANRAARRAGRTAGLLAAALLAFGPGVAAARCASVADQQNFEVEALKTELMVVATTCKGGIEDKYNAFVRRYQPQLLAANQGVSSYYARRGGARANDFFITELANVRSNQARALGSDFCARNSALYDEVMSLSGPQDLGPYAATKDLLSSGIAACPSGGSAPTTATRTASKSKRK